MFSRPDGASVDDIYERKVYILNKVMNDHIGMGKVQWQLFLLSGWGWMADNLWLQGVAIILPQVEREFNIQSDVRWMTFSLYCGLILGAATWGILADVIGRRPSFNITLCIAGIFGIAGGAAPSFVGLGGLLAALGFGLGGNLPVDGMMFLEFVPAKSQYLLTLLSVFWSLGQLLASLVAWAFIANYSCNGNQSNTVTGPNTVACDVSQNKGWRYSFYTFGALTFAMFIARYFVFNLPESPKYYLSRGRDADAVAVLKDIAARNGKPLGDDVISVEIFRSAAGQEASMDAQEIEHKPKGMKRITSAPKEFIHNFKGVSFTPDLSHVRPLFFGWRMAVTTSLLWVLWSLIGLAYPLYNAFLPIYLSEAQGLDGASDVNTTYRNYAIISVCGVPGSIIAAWAVSCPLWPTWCARRRYAFDRRFPLPLHHRLDRGRCAWLQRRNGVDSKHYVRNIVLPYSGAFPCSASRNRRWNRCCAQPYLRSDGSHHRNLRGRHCAALRGCFALPSVGSPLLPHPSRLARQECALIGATCLLRSSCFTRIPSHASRVQKWKYRRSRLGSA